MAEQLARKIEQIVRKVSGIAHGPVVLHEPFFNGNERQYVTDCIDTNWVSTVGKYVNLFEQQISRTTGVKHTIATINGTAALHICLQLAGVQPGDEVLMQALTFVASANAIAYCNATPHFIDVSPVSLGVCPERLREHLKAATSMQNGILLNKVTGRPIRALMVMHTFGHPSQLDELLSICNEYGLKMIEDAAEAIGSEYHGRHVGNHGLISALSFNGNKTITTGGGGAILTNDDHLAQQARHLTTTGKVTHIWEYHHDCIAYNYRLPNINAALGCAQLEQLGDVIMKKRVLASRYQHEFKQVADLSFFNEMPGVKSNYWLNAVILKTPDMETRNQLLNTLNADGIMVRPIWNLMNRLPMYAACPAADLSISHQLEQSVINIPSSPSF
ncbi:MAG TPA: LegC family aminotransferase [Candidatus Rifleibacterium sp.]|nr:LegC family aminotransferase [Candidatus Rifleibacterium sp.]HPT46878.1 LegC family aminotransferase [Candidatus Rifleibacterium sp.]